MDGCQPLLICIKIISKTENVYFVQDTRHLYLDINPLPNPKACLGSDCSSLASATSYVSPLDFEVPMPTPKCSTSVSRCSSSTFLLSAASF